MGPRAAPPEPVRLPQPGPTDTAGPGTAGPGSAEWAPARHPQSPYDCRNQAQPTPPAPDPPNEPPHGRWNPGSRGHGNLACVHWNPGAVERFLLSANWNRPVCPRTGTVPLVRAERGRYHGLRIPQGSEACEGEAAAPGGGDPSAEQRPCAAQPTAQTMGVVSKMGRTRRGRPPQPRTIIGSAGCKEILPSGRMTRKNGKITRERVIITGMAMMTTYDECHMIARRGMINESSVSSSRLSRFTTSSCSRPLVARAPGPTGPGSPSTDVNLPPASVTIGTKAAMS